LFLEEGFFPSRFKKYGKRRYTAKIFRLPYQPVHSFLMYSAVRRTRALSGYKPPVFIKIIATYAG
jgi:hypothetical protein